MTVILKISKNTNFYKKSYTSAKFHKFIIALQQKENLKEPKEHNMNIHFVNIFVEQFAIRTIRLHNNCITS